MLARFPAHRAAGLVAVLAVGWAASAGPTRSASPGPAADPPAYRCPGLNRLRALSVPVPESQRQPLRHLSGTVTAVDADSVTVRGVPFRWYWSGMRYEAPYTIGRENIVQHVGTQRLEVGVDDWLVRCGEFEWRDRDYIVTLLSRETVTIREADQPTRRFPVTPDVWAGRVDHDKDMTFIHRLSDARVGDHIVLRLTGADGAEACAGVRIQGRPGGRVPYPKLDPPGDDLLARSRAEIIRGEIDQQNEKHEYEAAGRARELQLRRRIAAMEKELGEFRWQLAELERARREKADPRP
jgi:hypothetical protein